MDLLDLGLAPLTKFIGDDIFEQTRTKARHLSYADGQAIHSRGDLSVRFCVIHTGAVRLGRFQHNGAFNLLCMLGPGGCFGDGPALLGSIRTHSAYAIGSTKIDAYSANELQYLLETVPQFAQALRLMNAARLETMLELYDDARTLPAPVRLAKLIWVHTGQGKQPDGVICLQSDIAQMLGVSQVSVSNALKALENHNLIESLYRRVIVPDKPKLEAWLRKSGAFAH